MSSPEKRELQKKQMADELVRLFGPKPERSAEDNKMLLEMLKGWLKAESDPRQHYETPEDRAVAVEAATEALRRLGVEQPTPESGPKS
ncbi:MAG: hypothetical protein ACREKE_04315 [bacterium]